MSQIFICYSRQSQDIVEVLAKDIEDLGHDVWFDKELTGGQAWWDRKLDEIRECDIFVFALAPETLDSQACILERKYASDLRKTILLIMVADGVPIKLLPPDLFEIQYVDYRHQDKQAFISLNKAIKALPAPQPLPDPLPESPEVSSLYLDNIKYIKDRVDTKETLNFEEQSALVLKLKDGLREVDDHNELRDLLELMRKRDDLNVNVAKEIDDLLAGITVASHDPNKARNRNEPTIETLKGTAVFRSEPTKLSQIEIQAVLVDKDLYDYRLNPEGSGFKNDYEILESGKVVLDHASGLMWQQSGSDKQIYYSELQSYIEVLNRQQFAGHTDWRLPTLEEAISLMEPKKNIDGFYIDTVFEKKQRWIWTSDKPSDPSSFLSSSAWVVYFGLGGCSDLDVADVNIYVRAVRRG